MPCNLYKCLNFFEHTFEKPQNLSKCPTIIKKTSIYLEIILKSYEFFEKASQHFKKASIPLKLSLKSLVIFVKASEFLLFLFKNPWNIPNRCRVCGKFIIIIILIYSNKRKLRDILGNPKDKFEVLEKSGVYQVECTGCDAVYIGQTKRCLKTRYKEHYSSIRLNHPEKSNIARHVLQKINDSQDHTISLDQLTLIKEV
jgi:hypothetical protein